MLRGLECGDDKVCYDKSCASVAMMKWNEDYNVDNAECVYNYEPVINDTEIVPGYECLDNIENACVFGRKGWNEGAPFTV